VYSQPSAQFTSQSLFHSLQPLSPPYAKSLSHSLASSPPLPTKSLPIPPSTAESVEEKELALALALSVKESQEQQSKLNEQEDEDLARALQESLLQLEITRSESPETEADTIHMATSSPRQLSDSPMLKTDAFTDSPTWIGSGPWGLSSTDVTSAQSSSTSLTDSQPSRIVGDEALARHLATEDGPFPRMRPRLHPTLSSPQFNSYPPGPVNDLPRSISHSVQPVKPPALKSNDFSGLYHTAVNTATARNPPSSILPSSRPGDVPSPLVLQRQRSYAWLAISSAPPTVESGDKHAVQLPESEEALLQTPISPEAAEDEGTSSSIQFVDDLLLHGVCTSRSHALSFGH
jgi:hypothetical protein